MPTPVISTIRPRRPQIISGVPTLGVHVPPVIEPDLAPWLDEVHAVEQSTILPQFLPCGVPTLGIHRVPIIPPVTLFYSDDPHGVEQSSIAPQMIPYGVPTLGIHRVPKIPTAATAAFLLDEPPSIADQSWRTPFAPRTFFKPILLVQKKSATTSSGTISVTWTSSTTSGNLLLAFLGHDGNPGTVTPPSGWVQVGSTISNSPYFGSMWFYANAPSEAATGNWSFTATNNNSLIVAEYSGLAANPLDQTGSVNTGSSTTTTTNSITTTTGYQLVVAMTGNAKTSLPIAVNSSPTNSFAIEQSQNSSSPNIVTQCYVDRIVSSTGTYSTGTTLSASAAWGTLIASFSAVGSAGAPMPPMVSPSLGDPMLTGPLEVLPQFLTHGVPPPSARTPPAIEPMIAPWLEEVQVINQSTFPRPQLIPSGVPTLSIHVNPVLQPAIAPWLEEIQLPEQSTFPRPGFASGQVRFHPVIQAVVAPQLDDLQAADQSTFPRPQLAAHGVPTLSIHVTPVIEPAIAPWLETAQAVEQSTLPPQLLPHGVPTLSIHVHPVLEPAIAPWLEEVQVVDQTWPRAGFIPFGVPFLGAHIPPLIQPIIVQPVGMEEISPHFATRDAQIVASSVPTLGLHGPPLTPTLMLAYQDDPLLAEALSQRPLLVSLGVPFLGAHVPPVMQPAISPQLDDTVVVSQSPMDRPVLPSHGAPTLGLHVPPVIQPQVIQYADAPIFVGTGWPQPIVLPHGTPTAGLHVPPVIEPQMLRHPDDPALVGSDWPRPQLAAHGVPALSTHVAPIIQVFAAPQLDDLQIADQSTFPRPQLVRSGPSPLTVHVAPLIPPSVAAQLDSSTVVEQSWPVPQLAYGTPRQPPIPPRRALQLDDPLVVAATWPAPVLLISGVPTRALHTLPLVQVFTAVQLNDAVAVEAASQRPLLVKAGVPTLAIHTPPVIQVFAAARLDEHHALEQSTFPRPQLIRSGVPTSGVHAPPVIQVWVAPQLDVVASADAPQVRRGDPRRVPPLVRLFAAPDAPPTLDATPFVLASPSRLPRVPPLVRSLALAETGFADLDLVVSLNLSPRPTTITLHQPPRIVVATAAQLDDALAAEASSLVPRLLRGWAVQPRRLPLFVQVPSEGLPLLLDIPPAVIRRLRRPEPPPPQHHLRPGVLQFPASEFGDLLPAILALRPRRGAVLLPPAPLATVAAAAADLLAADLIVPRLAPLVLANIPIRHLILPAAAVQAPRDEDLFFGLPPVVAFFAVPPALPGAGACIWTMIANAVTAVLQGLTFTGVPSTQVYQLLLPTDRSQDVGKPPFILVTLGPENEVWDGSWSGTDDWIYPVLVTFVDASNQSLTFDVTAFAWRRQVVRQISHRFLPGLMSTMSPGDVEIAAGTLVDPSLWREQNLNLGQVTVRQRSRESRPAPYPAIPGPPDETVYATLAQGVHAVIQSLGLATIPTSQVYLTEVSTDRQTIDVVLPAVVVSSGPQMERETGHQMNMDLWGYPVVVTFAKATNQNLAWDDQYLLWRQQVRQALHNRRLRVLSSSLRCVVEPGEVVDAAAFRDQNLTKGQLVIRAYSEEPYGQPALPPAATLIAPTDLQAVALSSTSVLLTWVHPGVFGIAFEVWRSGSPFALIATADLQTYTDLGLSPQATYLYEVRAVDTTASPPTYSAFSNIASVTTPANPPPLPPSALTVTAQLATEIDLSWTDNDATATALILQHSPDGSSWQSFPSLAASATTYADTGLPNATTRYYRVAAVNAAGVSPWSNVVSGTTAGAGATIPNAPTAQTATALSSTAVQLTWLDNSSNETAFQIDQSLDGVSWTNNVLSTAADVTTAIVTGLSALTLYYFRLSALNSAGSSATSSFPTVTTLATSPSKQVQLSAGLLAILRQAAINNTLQWTAFQAQLDARLNAVFEETYEDGSLYQSVLYALGYAALEISNPAQASKYADRALGFLQAGISTYVRNEYPYRRFLGRGDGVTTTFTIPDADWSPGTLTVYTAPVAVQQMTKGAASGHDVMPNGVGNRPIKVSNSPDGNADWTRPAQWRDNGDLSVDHGAIDWSAGGGQPVTGSTYYVTYYHPATASVVHAAQFSVSGTTITFTTPPAANAVIAASYMHGTWSNGGATLGYQQSIDPLDVSAYNNIFIDSSWVTRYLQALAKTHDWLYDYSGYSASLKASVQAMLVRWYNYIKAGVGVWQPFNQQNNYGAAHYLFRMSVMAALQGRDPAAATMLADMQAMRSSNVVPLFSSGGGLEGGYTSEGWSYGQAAEIFLLDATSIWLGNPALGVTPAAEQAWCQEQVQATYHSCWYHNPVLSYPGGGGWWYTTGAANQYSQPIAPVGYRGDLLALDSYLSTDANAPKYANNILQNWGLTQNISDRDLLFRNPTGAAVDPTISAYPLAYYSPGARTVFSRADWSFGSTWLAIDFDYQQASGWSYALSRMSLSRGGDDLLSCIPTWADDRGTFRSLYDNIVTINASGQFATFGVDYLLSDVPVFGPELGSGYTWFGGDVKAAFTPRNSKPRANGGACSLCTRQVLHILPDLIVVQDRVGTLHASDTKTQRWGFPLAGSLTVSGNTWTAARGGSKLLGTALGSSAVAVSQQTVVDNGKSAPMIFVDQAAPQSQLDFITVLQSAAAAHSIWPASYLQSADGRLEGALVNNATVALFGVAYPDGAGSINPWSGTCSYSLTVPAGVVNHYVANVEPGRVFTVAVSSGSGPGTVTASAGGILSFATTSTGAAQTVTLS